MEGVRHPRTPALGPSDQEHVHHAVAMNAKKHRRRRPVLQAVECERMASAPRLHLAAQRRPAFTRYCETKTNERWPSGAGDKGSILVLRSCVPSHRPRPACRSVRTWSHSDPTEEGPSVGVVVMALVPPDGPAPMTWADAEEAIVRTANSATMLVSRMSLFERSIG